MKRAYKVIILIIVLLAPLAAQKAPDKSDPSIPISFEYHHTGCLDPLGGCSR